MSDAALMYIGTARVLRSEHVEKRAVALQAPNPRPRRGSSFLPVFNPDSLPNDLKLTLLYYQ
jgi:hypothetical protein